MASEFKVLKADNLFLYSLCTAVRSSVFVEEQSCPIAEEFDQDEDHCIHYVAVENRDGHVVPLGTARWRHYSLEGKNAAKIERVAVMKEARGRGVAKVMMEALVGDIKEDAQSFDVIVLNSQDYAIPFYNKFGFSAYGDGNIEAGIPHHMMRKEL